MKGKRVAIENDVVRIFTSETDTAGQPLYVRWKSEDWGKVESPKNWDQDRELIAIKGTIVDVVPKVKFGVVTLQLDDPLRDEDTGTVVKVDVLDKKKKPLRDDQGQVVKKDQMTLTF